MSVIALVNQKGGCSKSTSSVHLAYWLSRKGHKVHLLDADAQRSSSIWLKSMDDNQISTTVLQSPDDLLEQIPDLATQCDHLIIDGPAGLSEASRAILFRCDLAVIPCQPTGLDLQSASDAVRLIKQAQSVRGGAPQAAIFISRAVKGTKLLGEAVTLLSKSKEVIILKTVIHQKQVIADTFGQSATIWDLSGRPAAESAREYERLFKEIMGMLK
ncbi:AAA family ATPase [Nostoc sp. FACHB-87]|uniref:AAA family ATPase n=1 Tax=Nostocaceae TaxID=1162 RepID=UPI001682944F|nr:MULTISPECIES: AAA family ATPase [Nostocaceae]MBD2458421.1 AAA family ATPase [Nostoc sp. FACHB-87]MBD2479483.1 AAA family ATPase [Anabaena sp. FACHB-83]